MPRVLVLLTLLLLGLAGSAPLLSAGPEACVVSCADEDDEGSCPADCVDCACCARQPTPLVAQVCTGVVRVDAVRSRSQGVLGRGRMAVARKIPHVPKRSAR